MMHGRHWAQRDGDGKVCCELNNFAFLLFVGLLEREWFVECDSSLQTFLQED